MRVIKSESGFRRVKGTILTLGNFDGLHLGHCRIIKKVVRRARDLGAPAVVYTFDPHPLKVVSPEKSPPLILDLDGKKRLIEDFGVDWLVLASFTKEFAAKHPREFVEDVLVKGLSVREVWVGHDYSFGRGRTGTVEYMKELGREFGFSVYVIPAYMKGGQVISSSRIRSLVTEGKVGEAARLLGRDYSIKGIVIRGRDIGGTLGFPTANLRVTSELTPGSGVYAAKAAIEGKLFISVVNIGVAPTFGAKETTVEVHILGFNRNIYGRKIEVSFARRLRGERMFKSKEELVRRIKKDIERTKKILRG